METEVRQREWDGRCAWSLKAGDYSALVVPSLGANVISLTYEDRRSGRQLDILRTPKHAQDLLDNPYAYGIPVLFPANRIAGGEFTYDGITYRFPQNYPNGVHIHGVLHNYEWSVTECRADQNGAEVVLRASTEDPHLRACFPIDLIFQLECVLTDQGLLQRFTLKNNSDVTMPFGLAYHTAFKVPFVEGGRAEDVRLSLPLDGLCLDDPVNRLPSGEIGPLTDLADAFTAPGGAFPLQKQLDALYRARSGGSEAVLRDLKTGREIVYKADRRDKYWIVWNGQLTDFVAVEPQTWLSNAVHLPDGAAHGVLYSTPHSAWQCETAIYVR